MYFCCLVNLQLWKRRIFWSDLSFVFLSLCFTEQFSQNMTSFFAVIAVLWRLINERFCLQGCDVAVCLQHSMKSLLALLWHLQPLASIKFSLNEKMCDNQLCSVWPQVVYFKCRGRLQMKLLSGNLVRRIVTWRLSEDEFGDRIMEVKSESILLPLLFFCSAEIFHGKVRSLKEDGSLTTVTGSHWWPWILIFTTLSYQWRESYCRMWLVLNCSRIDYWGQAFRFYWFLLSSCFWITPVVKAGFWKLCWKRIASYQFIVLLISSLIRLCALSPSLFSYNSAQNSYSKSPQQTNSKS